MKKMLLVLAVVGVLMIPGRARADSLIPFLVGVTPNGANFDWTYVFSLSFGSQAVPFVVAPALTPGAAIQTLFDFPGIVAVVPAPGWGFLVDDSIKDGGLIPDLPPGQVCSVGPVVLCPPDSSAIKNIMFAYGPGGPTILGPAVFGPFVITSTRGVPSIPGSYFGQDECGIAGCGTGIGSIQSNFGLVQVPSVPEPTSLLLLGTGLLGLVGVSRKKKKNDPAV